MKLVIVGASGFIGSQLSRAFSQQGHKVAKVSHLQLSSASLQGADVVINLSGASVTRRWTKCYMQKIYSSRIATTNRLVNIINVMPTKPKLLINASAVGIYKIGGIYKETDEQLGDDFLAEVCKDWENEAKRVSSGVRLVLMRLGAVMSNEGGALQRIVENTKFLKMAVQLGNGHSFLPWIAMSDLIKAVMFVVENPLLSGEVNMVAPKSVEQGQMARIIGNALGIKRVLRLPIWLLRCVIGRNADILTDSRQVVPDKLLKAGFNFDCQSFEDLSEQIAK